METPAPVARTLCVSLLAALSSMTTPTCARADDSPRWLLRAGLTPVQAKPRGHSAARVDDGVAVTLEGTCMLSPHWGVELLSALPVKHDIRLESGAELPLSTTCRQRLACNIGLQRLVDACKPTVN